MASPQTEAILRRAIAGITSSVDVNYAAIAGFTLLFYDYILTFADEVKFIWTSRRSLGKLLFFLNRYVTQIDLLLQIHLYTNLSLSKKSCTYGFKASLWLNLFVMMVTELMLVLRTYALWGGNKTILIVLGLAFMLCDAACFGLLIEITRSIYYVRAPTKFVRSCYFDAEYYLLYGYFVPSLVFQVIIFSLTIWKARQHISAKPELSPLFETLYRDGFLFFIVVFAMTLANHLVFILGSNDYKRLLNVLLEVLTSISCNRLFLNLHASNTATGSAGRTTTPMEMSTFRAAEPADEAAQAGLTVRSIDRATVGTRGSFNFHEFLLDEEKRMGQNTKA